MKRLVIAFAVGLLACGHSITWTPTNTPPRPLSTRNAASVEILTATVPSRPFVEVGLFEIEQDSPHSGGTSEMITKLRARAAQVGCDALLLGGSTERVQSVTTQHMGTVQASSPGMTNGSYSGTGYSSVNTVRGHRATCIVYTDAPTPATAPVTTL